MVSSDFSSSFSGIDFVLFSLVLVISFLIGLYHGVWSKNKQHTPEEYFLGSRNMGVLPVTMSLIVTFVSGVNIIGLSVETYVYGTYLWHYVFTIFIMLLFTTFIFLPIFHELQLPSSFAYLKLRFGRSVQLLASFIYLMTTTLYVSINLYVPALVLVHVLGIPIPVTVVVLGSVCIFYTAIGGFSAVIWADLFQTILLVVCCVAISYIGLDLVGGVDDVWKASERGGRLILFDFNPDPTVRLSSWTMLFGHSLVITQTFGLSQTSIQRFLSVKNLSKARQVVTGYYFGFLFFHFFTLASALIMYAFYESCDPVASGVISKRDQLFSLFVFEMAEHFPGLPGLFIAGVFAGTLSTMSSCLNSSTVCFYEDFVQPHLPEMSQRKTCNILKLITLCIGIIEISLVFILEKIGTVYTILITITGFTSGSMLGLFTLGMFIPRANQKASVHRPRQALKRPTVQHAAIHQPVVRALPRAQVQMSGASPVSNIYEKHLLSQTTFEGGSREGERAVHLSLSAQQRQLMAIIASRGGLFAEPKQPLYEVIDAPQTDARPPPKPRSKAPKEAVMRRMESRIDPVGGNLTPEPVELGCIFNSVGHKFEYRNTGRLHLETLTSAVSQSVRMPQGHKVTSSGQGLHKSRATEIFSSSDRGGFCGALQRTPPAMPAAISRRLANRENAGIGKVKVMLRIADNPATCDEGTTSSYLSVDKKKRQVTLSDPSQASLATHQGGSQERGPMVAAPKMFAFDGLFTPEDTQSDLCSAALSDVIPAVLDGSDGCLLALGYPGAGQSKSMMGSISGAGELGAIPCAISWLYRGINERRQKSGARFSVRVSALGVNATKPGSSSRDLLAAHATESDESPGVYLRDDFLGGPTELRAPTAERAALFLDTALAGRGHSSALEPALIFTLHVYQYSLAGKGGVAGGRSRLHLIDLGGCANRAGGLPLSGIGNVLLAILSGQRHPPNRDHPLTPLLKDCLAPITCHVAVLAHVTHAQTHSDALTTIQLASRIHRMRRRKHRFQLSGADKGIALGSNAAGHQSGGSSEGPDPSSSDLSADTVIYMGPCDDQTDGEHPPVYLPSLSSGDNRCAMQKVLKGTTAEKPNKSPAKKVIPKPEYQATAPIVQSTLAVAQRTDSLKRVYDPGYQNTTMSPVKQKIPTSPYKYPMSLNKASNVPTPKGSPLRRPNMVNSPHESPIRKVTEEKWIDGPRVSRSKVAEARHLMREINHVKQCETWVDGPKTATQSASKTLVAGCLPGALNPNGAYGFMDSHKKSMIRQWVENQTSQMLNSGHQCVSSPSSPHHQRATYHMTQFKCSRSEDDQRSAHESGAKREEENHSEHTANTCPQPTTANENQEEEDQDSGPSEVPPALPLIDRLGSREISHESLHLGSSCSRHISRENLPGVQMMDCGLQVTEEEIAKTMGSGIGTDHPLSALSHGDMSIVSSFHVGDTFSDCVIGDNSRHQFDQLARLREIFTSQLAMAEVTPVFRVGGDAGSVYSEPAYRFNGGTGSVCSEPVCRAPSPRCRDCRQSITLSRSPSQTSLPSLNGIVAIAGMEQYASLRHPDGASDPNLQKIAQLDQEDSKPASSPVPEEDCGKMLADTPLLSQTQLPQLPPLPLSTSEAYDSGHDSTPRTSKHSGISRRAESGYHSVATVRDSDESSFSSAAGSKVQPREPQKIHAKKSKRNDKSLCHWLRSPFNCTYPDTEGEVSDF